MTRSDSEQLIAGEVPVRRNVLRPHLNPVDIELDLLAIANAGDMVPLFKRQLAAFDEERFLGSDPRGIAGVPPRKMDSVRGVVVSELRR